MTYSYSIRGRINEATCTKGGDIKFFLNKINDNCKPKDWDTSKDVNIHKFIAYLSAVELHELGHAFNWKDGCNHGKQLGFEECPWCAEVEKIYGWLL